MRQDERSATWRRTRTTLLQAAIALLRAGETPTVADAARKADVSRRTAYRYFPTGEQLLTEAALELLRPAVEGSFASIESDPYARLESAVRAIQKQAILNERLLRTMIRLTVARDDIDETAAGAPLRGTRRVAWIESALEPARSKLTPAALTRLVSAICTCVGPEALIVLRDIRGLDSNSATEIIVWATSALLRSALAEGTS